MTQQEEKLPITSVTTDISRLDTIIDDTISKRNKVIEFLGNAIGEQQLDTSKSRQAEVQLQLVNTYLSALKENEDSIVKRIRSKVKMVEADSSEKHSAAVVELLSRINVKDISLGNNINRLDPAEIERRIEMSLESSNLPPVMDTELKTDPTDMND